MISTERMQELCSMQSMPLIRHTKTGGEYFIICEQKAKIGGLWTDGVMYLKTGVNSAPQYFWRTFDNFEGFEEVVCEQTS